MRLPHLFAPQLMHIPDGFLSVVVSVVFWLISIVVIAMALKKTGNALGDKQLPLMGVLAAAIFAGQMMNFTVAGGTSGHLLGAALATILLGPWPAVIVMTSVVSVQALLFQDGGLLALGANLFNMAVIGVFVSYAVYTVIFRIVKKQTWGMMMAGFISAWASIFIASLLAALQLALSGTSPANIAVPAMGGIHAIIGIGEGLITVGALAFVYAARKDLLTAGDDTNKGSKGVVITGALIAIVLAILSPLASSHPDGLERVAEDLGFIEKAREALFNIIPGYAFPGIHNEALATIAAGILGAAVVFAVAFGVSRNTKKPVSRETESGE